MTATAGVPVRRCRAAGTLSADGWQRLEVVTDVPTGTPEAQGSSGDPRRAGGRRRARVPDRRSDAALVDTLAAIGAPLPLALAIIVITTFVMLFLFTGSVVQPLRALVVNALSLCAALGIDDLDLPGRAT